MTNIVNFLKYKPVHYTVHFTHDENEFSVQVMDVADDEESRRRVADAMEHAARMIREEHKDNANG